MSELGYPGAQAGIGWNAFWTRSLGLGGGTVAPSGEGLFYTNCTNEHELF